jgi:hypothetical protein
MNHKLPFSYVFLKTANMDITRLEMQMHFISSNKSMLDFMNTSQLTHVFLPCLGAGFVAPTAVFVGAALAAGFAAAAFDGAGFLAVAPLAGLGFRGISVAVCPVRLEPCQ